MGDLGLPGSVVEMPDDGAAEEPVGSAQGRPQHHDEPEGRRQAGELHRGLRGAARAPGRLHRRADRGVRAPRHARHLVRACLGRHAARAADPRHARATARRKMRAIAEEAAALVRKYKGAFSGEHGDGLCRGEWIDWQFGPTHQRRLPRDQGPASIPTTCSTPARSSTRRRWTTRGCSASRRGYARTHRARQPALDWSAWNVQNDPVTEATTAPGTGGDPTGGFAKAVEMCNNNGHCRKFDAGTMCPSYRVTRDEQHLTRGRANTLRLALSGQLGAGRAAPATRCTRRWTCASAARAASATARPASTWRKMKIEFLGAATRARTASRCKDRLIARPAATTRAWRSRVPWLLEPAQPRPGAAPARRALLGLSAQRSLPRWRSDTFWRGADARPREPRRGARGRRKAVVLFVDTFNGNFETENARRRGARAAGRRLRGARGRADDGGGTLCCGRTYLAAGMVDEARGEGRRAARRAAAVRRARHRRSSASSRRAC